MDILLKKYYGIEDFDETIVSQIKKYKGQISRKEKELLQKKIEKSIGADYLLILTAIRLYSIWEPDEAIYQARLKGAFRYKIWKTDNYSSIILNKLLSEKDLYSYSEESIGFINNKLNLSWLYEYYLREEGNILHILKKLHKNRKIYASVNNITLEENIIKDLLAYIDYEFHNYNKRLDCNLNDLSGYSEEEKSESVSYLIFLFKNNIELKDNHSFIVNDKTIDSAEFKRAILLGCKLCKVTEWETFVDFYGYNTINTEKNTYCIEPKDVLFDKSYQLAYILQNTRRFYDYQNILQNENFVSIHDVFKSYIEKCPDEKLFSRITKFGFTRLRYKLNELLFRFLNAIDDNHLYFEEMVALRNFTYEYSCYDSELLARRITDNCTLIDVIKFQRIFILLSYIYDDTLYSKEQKKIIFNTILPAFTNEALKNVLKIVFKNEEVKINELISLFSPDMVRKLDLQYEPLVKLTHSYYIPVSLLAKSNIMRNCIASSRKNKNQTTNSMSEPMVKECAEIFVNADYKFDVFSNRKISYKGKKGEIDVLVITENYILIIECCKCQYRNVGF